MPTLPARPSLLVWLLVLAVHGLALLGLQSHKMSSTREQAAGLRLPRIELRLLAPTVQSAPIAPTHGVEPTRPRVRSSVRPASEEQPPTAQPAVGGPQTTAPTTTDGAAVPRVEESLLNSEATRRALRSSTTAAPTPAQLAVEAGATLRAPTANERLSDEVQRAGTGDCAKGQYAGAGMGLLSLPFLAAAALRGDCAK